MNAPHPACRLSVVIPARNEAALIGDALAALMRQRDFDGSRIPAGLFEVIVFANNCSDTTAALARDLAAVARFPIYVVEDTLPPAQAHIGAARKHVMDLAAARFSSVGRPQGIIASTDSDTVVDADWIAWTLREARTVDAVAGCVAIAAADQAQLLAPVRILYARELTYRRLVAEVEARIDPVPEDPLPRHSSFVGASFAVSTRAYLAAGGLPPLPRLEDQNFCRALRRIDARIRHSQFVRATTSARRSSRVDGGFGAFIAHLHERAERGETFRVEHPHDTLDLLRCRSALRRVWSDRSVSRGDAVATHGLRADVATIECYRADAPTFGIFYERVIAAEARPARPEASVEVAIDALHRAARQLTLRATPLVVVASKGA